MRALSKLGIASRAQTRELILAGRISVDGRAVISPEILVSPERSVFRLDGKALQRPAARTILLHKPRGVVTTRSDPDGRQTVYDLLEGVEDFLGPVGRLDFATSGLLLLSNDTKLGSWLTDPGNAIPRVYVVTVRGDVSDATLALLEQGVIVDSDRLAASRVLLRKRSKRESHLTLELLEGKNREIRRLLGAVGHEVTRLKRVSFGGLELGKLGVGAWRDVPEDELRRAFPGAPLRRLTARQSRQSDGPARSRNDRQAASDPSRRRGA